MKEKLYTIPVNDAFREDCECPLCSIYHKLEQDALEYTLRPSTYMVSERREESDKVGFCKRHAAMLNEMPDRLGLALIYKTHMDSFIKEIEQRQKEPVKQASFFKKKDGSLRMGWYYRAVGENLLVLREDRDDVP